MTDKKIEKTQPLVKVGDEIMFSNVGMAHTAVKGVVIKVGRVWIDVANLIDSRVPAGRFRLDTQKGDPRGPYDARFWTIEQHAEAMRERDNRRFLRHQGIDLDSWRSKLDGWTPTTLANAIRLAQSVGDPAELFRLIEGYGHACAGDTFTPANEILTKIQKRLGLTDDQHS
jgi:hypothetical protein